MARESYVEAMVHDQVRGHTDPRRIEGRRLGWCGNKSLVLRIARQKSGRQKTSMSVGWSVRACMSFRIPGVVSQAHRASP